MSYKDISDSQLLELVKAKSQAEKALTLEVIQLLREVESGELSLSNVARAQSFFRKEARLKNKKITVETKKEILKMLENKSTRDAQRTLLELSPEHVNFKETEKVLRNFKFNSTTLFLTLWAGKRSLEICGCFAALITCVRPNKFLESMLKNRAAALTE